MNNEIREKIIEINKLAGITAEEKSKMIQKLYSKPVVKERSIEEVKECQHYKRKCLIEANCCGNIYECRVCHDEVEDHKMNRHETKYIICKECDKKQVVSNKCEECGVIFGEYYCEICRLWDSSEKKKFHCEKCGICRIGTLEEYEHCDVCGICVVKKEHKCIKDKSRSDCPVCLENLFYSRRNILQLKCGHTIHGDCFEEYCKKDYRCPLCKKAVIADENLKSFWESIRLMNHFEVPVIYRDWISKVYCIECEEKSYVPFQVSQHYCRICRGYNTQIEGNFRPEEDGYMNALINKNLEIIYLNFIFSIIIFTM